jgi:hypothetical protein
LPHITSHHPWFIVVGKDGEMNPELGLKILKNYVIAVLFSNYMSALLHQTSSGLPALMPYSHAADALQPSVVVESLSIIFFCLYFQIRSASLYSTTYNLFQSIISIQSN